MPGTLLPAQFIKAASAFHLLRNERVGWHLGKKESLIGRSIPPRNAGTQTCLWIYFIGIGGRGKLQQNYGPAVSFKSMLLGNKLRMLTSYLPRERSNRVSESVFSFSHE